MKKMGWQNRARLQRQGDPWPETQSGRYLCVSQRPSFSIKSAFLCDLAEMDNRGQDGSPTRWNINTRSCMDMCMVKNVGPVHLLSLVAIKYLAVYYQKGLANNLDSFVHAWIRYRRKKIWMICM